MMQVDRSTLETKIKTVKGELETISAQLAKLAPQKAKLDAEVAKLDAKLQQLQAEVDKCVFCVLCFCLFVVVVVLLNFDTTFSHFCVFRESDKIFANFCKKIRISNIREFEEKSLAGVQVRKGEKQFHHRKFEKQGFYFQFSNFFLCFKKPLPQEKTKKRQELIKLINNLQTQLTYNEDTRENRNKVTKLKKTIAEVEKEIKQHEADEAKNKARIAKESQELEHKRAQAKEVEVSG